MDMLSLGSLNACTMLLAGILMHKIVWAVLTSVMVRMAPTELLFPTADAARSSSMLTLGDTVIPVIFVALALCIALPKCSKNRFFNCAFLQYNVGLTTIIMKWFQAAQGGCTNQLTNQLMGQVWDWNNICVTKPKKFDGWVLHTANEDGNGGEDDTTALSEDRGDGYGGEEDTVAPLEDHVYGGEEDDTAPLEDHDGDQDDGGAVSEDSNDDILPYGDRAVQVLAIRANFPIQTINGYDWCDGRCIYTQHMGEVQEEGMVDLIPIGPGEILMAESGFRLEVFHSTTTTGDEGSSRVSSPIRVGWDVCDEDDCEYTQIIYGGPGRMLEITYLVIPKAIEANVEVRLKLKDLGSRSHVVYGKIKASATDYGNKSVHLFSRKRGRSWSVPSESSILPLTPSVIALPRREQLELQLEVDLTIIAISTSGNEEERKLKFTSLKFTPRVRSQEREVDEDQIGVNITFQEICI